MTKVPGIFSTIAEIRREGRLSHAALKHYLLGRLPILVLAVAGLIIFLYVGLWGPMEKALFSWHEGLPFDYGGIILHATFCLFLLAAAVVGLLRLYRRESRLLRLFNYGQATQDFTFSADGRTYTYTDPQGGSHTRHFAQDHAGLTFGNRELNTGVRPAQGIWSPPDAGKCAQSLMGQPANGYVLFLPERPDIFHMVIGKGMDSYRLRKD